jgi:hypothetical protein
LARAAPKFDAADSAAALLADVDDEALMFIGIETPMLFAPPLPDDDDVALWLLPVPLVGLVVCASAACACATVACAAAMSLACVVGATSCCIADCACATAACADATSHASVAG